MLCEQIQKSSFADPPFASGLRKADIAICLLHSLTMILSYHREFQKQDEDEIVRTFVFAMGAYERSARTCIHALSICCHELPLDEQGPGADAREEWPRSHRNPRWRCTSWSSSGSLPHAAPVRQLPRGGIPHRVRHRL